MRLSILDDDRLCISAFGAFKGARIVSQLVSRLDECEQHGKPAGGAAALTDRRSFWNETTRNWHSGSPG
jgi:hypothetical protein